MNGPAVGTAPLAPAVAPAFGPDRPIWRVHRELALLLGGGRALLLQIAHPLVAAGVAEHSRFARDPFGRLIGTLEPMYALLFGGPEAARLARARMRAAHARVRGVLVEPASAFAAGTPYDAADPELRLWVHATLADTSLCAHRWFVGRLPAGDEDRYYADSRRLARLLDVPDAAIPPTLPAFRAYMEAMLAGDTLDVGPVARRLAREVLHPPAAPLLRAVGPLLELLTAGLLPPRVREQYGLGWSTARARAFRLAAAAIRGVRPALPGWLRVVPQARQAERRRG